MDNYIVSARKYRPSTFRSVVGQKSLTTTLKNAIAGNKLAHAYLFCGPRGVGKTSCARIFAKTINCFHPTANGEACNECESCIAFNEQRSYNIHELDAASNNSVDDIRSLIDQVRIPPALGKYKVFIIDEVHMLSSAAFNAFLKTLEEPPYHALFILATTEKHKVLATILSRCQIYDFSRISIADMVEHLEYVASQEHVSAEPEALNVIAQKADGGMRDALSIFDQVVSFTNGNITYQTVIDNLNVLDYEYYFKLTDAMLSGNVRSAILTLNEILSKGFDGQNVISGLASHFRDLLVCRDEATLVLFEVGASIRERYKKTAQQCSEQLLYKAIELANNCDLNYRASRNKRLLLELTLIQLCQINRPPQDDSKKKLLIEPVGESSPANQPSPQSKVVTTQVPSNVSVATSSNANVVTQKKAPSQIPVSTSIKKVIQKEEGTGSVQQSPAASDLATPYEINDLLNYWDEYTQKIEKNAYLKGIMVNCKPVLQENFHFEVAVHNPGQKDELLNDSINLLPFLRSNLKNNHIQMCIRISETNEKKLAYTSTEKYEHLININPVLDKLKNEFNLTLE
ncbi:MAG: DNA polymerase III subunit gamma/tau [Tannerellaceae bacterium]|jgi:DNA polymerase-3 subunit gamma/tau|nr:DNA polymerase III subunit gamma/tau [Tannerellaceae bacterium]